MFVHAILHAGTGKPLPFRSSALYSFIYVHAFSFCDLPSQSHLN